MAFCMGNFDSRFLPQRVKDALSMTIPQYGVRFDGTNSAGIRTYDAAGMKWQRSSNAVAGDDDFANVAPFNVRECITQYDSTTGGRQVLAYKGDANWASLVASKTGDRMIEIPCFWYYRPSKYEIIIAPEAKVGFKPSPAHYRNGVLKDVIRVSKYALNSNYVSQTGFAPRVSTNMNTFRSNLRAKGQYLMDYPTWCSLTMLMLVKYANMDIQNTVGFGWAASSNTGAKTSGDADSLLGLDGNPSGSLGANESVLTLGIENLYSNVWKYIDGLFTYGGYAYHKDIESISQDPANYTELIQQYTKVATPIIGTASNATIRDIVFDSVEDFMFFPTATGTPSPTGDACWAATTFDCVLVGGHWHAASSAGLFSFDCLDAVGGVGPDYGACAVEF